MIQGINDSMFYKILEGSLLQNGYSSIEDFFRVNPNYWYDEEAWKRIYDLPTISNPSRMFEQKIGNQTVPIMATYLSDDAETPLISNEGFEKQTGDMPRMGQGLFFSTKTAEDYQRLEREIGVASANDAVYRSFVRDARNLIQGVHSQRSFTGFQIESKGSYISTKVNNNGGIANLKIDVHPVKENRKGCGGFAFAGSGKGKKFAWTSDSACPIGDLQDMFHYGWNKHLVSADHTRSVFRRSKTAYDLLKGHKDTKTKVAMWKSGLLVSAENIQYYNVTDADLAAYLNENSIPKIEVESYYGFTNVFNKETATIEQKEISAFDTNTVVLRYAGKFGEMQWARVNNIFVNSTNPMYYTENGAIAIQEEHHKKGIRYSVESLCVPVPYAIEKVLYLSINEAAV